MQVPRPRLVVGDTASAIAAYGRQSGAVWGNGTTELGSPRDSAAFTWRVSDSTVATVSRGGVVRALRAGRAGRAGLTARARGVESRQAAVVEVVPPS